MTNKTRRTGLVAGVLLVIAAGAGVLIASSINNPFNIFARKPVPQSTRQNPQQKASKATASSTRNLSMQPLAFGMARRLGGRFAAAKRDKSTLAGTLMIGSESRALEMIRSQTDGGEQIEIHVAGKQEALTWDAESGAQSSKAQAAGGDRDLIERIALDSPDQFVLAQLRGANYFTVARNLRPAKADDNYAGPLWDIVRVSDPQTDEMKRPQSPWRLYYVNTQTGLIDKIESEVTGQRIVAEILRWTEINGEKVPAQMRWTSNGQVLMQYALSHFSRSEN